MVVANDDEISTSYMCNDEYDVLINNDELHVSISTQAIVALHGTQKSYPNICKNVR